MRRRNWAALGLIFVMAACGTSLDNTNLPSHSPTKIETSASPTASAAPKKAAKGSSATFRHFKVTVTRLIQTKSDAKPLAKVCVRSLPPDPQGNRTRISCDPWSIRAGGRTVKPTSGTFPREATYKKGQCASGSMIFKTSQKVAKIEYANFVGNKAVWDVRDLSAKSRSFSVPVAMIILREQHLVWTTLDRVDYPAYHRSQWTTSSKGRRSGRTSGCNGRSVG